MRSTRQGRTQHDETALLHKNQLGRIHADSSRGHRGFISLAARRITIPSRYGQDPPHDRLCLSDVSDSPAKAEKMAAVRFVLHCMEWRNRVIAAVLQSLRRMVGYGSEHCGRGFRFSRCTNLPFLFPGHFGSLIEKDRNNALQRPGGDPRTILRRRLQCRRGRCSGISHLESNP